MKRSLLCLFAILALFLEGRCVFASDRATELAAKGYELYSWQRVDGTRRYSLVPGTNRSKTNDEVTAPAVEIGSVAELKHRLAGLARNEQVFWHLPAGERFSFPEAHLVEELRLFCRSLHVTLHVHQLNGGPHSRRNDAAGILRSLG